MDKVCKHHGLSKFFFNKYTPYGKCTICRNEFQKRRRDSIKEKLIDIYGGKCIKCGYDKCKKALHFHHLDPNTKEFTISHKIRTRPWETIIKEADKCIMICANCHAEIHENEK